MTRLDLLKVLIGQARDKGFEFRRWYTGRLAQPWTSAEDAFAYLEKHRHYYALLFSHEFARAFWAAGQALTFQVPAQSFQRRMADGSIRTVTRKPFMRRTARADVWRYHLREMAAVDEPLRYIRKFLAIEEDLRHERTDSPAEPEPVPSRKPPHPTDARPVPATLALARKTHERRQLARAAGAGLGEAPEPSRKRGARPPGSR